MFCRHTQLLDFYPRPPRGGRPHPVLPAVGRSRYFYPRPPRGERLGAAPEEPEQKEISIHALREESDQYPCWRIPERRISIHALREESDKVVGALLPLSFNFYPRPPRGERRAVRTACALLFCKFLSTPSARRATMVWERLTAPDRYFYPRPPRGERRCGLAKSALPRVISIHALREESDPSSYFALYLVLYFYPRPPRGERRAVRTACALLFCKFLSTPSARRATQKEIENMTAFDKFLSTPSARRATAVTLTTHLRRRYFYPRPPRGERPVFRSVCRTRSAFLSTPSARRATGLLQLWSQPAQISIHALREESDGLPFILCPPCCYFYPRPPRGERRPLGRYIAPAIVFLSTPSARRATSRPC